MIFILVAVFSLVVACLTLFSGFGLGTLFLPAFSLLFPIELAVAATAIVHFANNIFKFFLVWKMAHRRTTIVFTVPAIFTAAFGAWLLSRLGQQEAFLTYQLFGKELHVELVQLTLGFLIFVFAFLEMGNFFKNISMAPKYIPLGGAISGFFGGLSGMQGALRSVFLIRAGLTKEQYVGTSVVSAIIIDMSRLIVYGVTILSNHFYKIRSGKEMYIIAIAIIFAFAGSYTGSKLLVKTTIDFIHKVVGILLLLVSVGLMSGIL